MATGEACQNRVIFKQLMQAEAISYCQIDSCRIGGVNELLSVILMAAKFNIPVCPHAGGVGLCEHVQHLSMFDFVCCSATLEDRIVEFVDHLHEHFIDPVVIKNGAYMPPKLPGYSIEMKPESITDYTFPDGPAWQKARCPRTTASNELPRLAIPTDGQRGPRGTRWATRDRVFITGFVRFHFTVWDFCTVLDCLGVNRAEREEHALT